MIEILMSCLQIRMSVSIHLNSWGNYYSLHLNLRCTVQKTIAGAYYTSGGRLSLYAGKEVAIGEGFLEIGLASGYGEKATLMLRYRKGNVFIVPAWQEAKKESVYGVVLGGQF